MIESLIVSAALVVLPNNITDQVATVATSVVNTHYDDSGHHVWDNTPPWIRDFGRCVRHHESFHSGHYRADNPGSTASGAYQFLDGTWSGNAKYTKGAKKYAHLPASVAPPWVQDKVFIHSINHGGIHNWDGTNCGYGT